MLLLHKSRNSNYISYPNTFHILTASRIDLSIDNVSAKRIDCPFFLVYWDNISVRVEKNTGQRGICSSDAHNYYWLPFDDLMIREINKMIYAYIEEFYWNIQFRRQLLNL